MASDGGLSGAVGRGQNAQRRATVLAGELDGIAGVDDGPGVDDGDRRLERVDPLQEERTFLIVEEREPLVDRQHQLIRFNLGEVGGSR
jgi:hypothetical protein